MRSFPRIAVVAIVLAAGSGCARRPPSAAPPSTAACEAAARKAAAAPGSADFRGALTYGGLARCGDTGAVALAGALRGAGALRDTALLDDLVVQASANRHPLILQAALDVAADRTAPPVARAAGMHVALRQYAAHIGLPGGVARLAVLEVGPFCTYDYLPGVRYASERPLPAEHRDAIIVTMKRIADDAAEPVSMRDLAGCVARKVSEPARTP